MPFSNLKTKVFKCSVTPLFPFFFSHSAAATGVQVCSSNDLCAESNKGRRSRKKLPIRGLIEKQKELLHPPSSAESTDKRRNQVHSDLPRRATLTKTAPHETMQRLLMTTSRRNAKHSSQRSPRGEGVSYLNESLRERTSHLRLKVKQDQSRRRSTSRRHQPSAKTDTINSLGARVLAHQWRRTPLVHKGRELPFV